MRRGYDKDYYAILQVHPRAEPEIIQAAYKRLAAKYHPDVGGDEERMKQINEAWNVLGDPRSRRQYDAWYFTLGPGAAQAIPPAAKDVWTAVQESWNRLKWPLLITTVVLLFLTFDIFRLGVRLLPDWSVAALLAYLLLRHAWRR